MLQSIFAKSIIEYIKREVLIVEQQRNMTSLIMIFGATGDLAIRKLFPSLYRLFQKGKLDKFAVIGVARRPLSTEDFQKSVKDSVINRSRKKG